MTLIARVETGIVAAEIAAEIAESAVAADALPAVAAVAAVAAAAAVVAVGKMTQPYGCRSSCPVQLTAVDLSCPLEKTDCENFLRRSVADSQIHFPVHYQ